MTKTRWVWACLAVCAAHAQTARPDGLYADILTSKGRIVARLEPDLAPLAVANFAGLAEGTIANAAFDPGRPYFDGTVWHRVVPGHVIQTGVPQSDRAKAPGYSFPNEIHAKLSHNHAGSMNMANAGPGTNGSQFCFMLGDRGYLDGNYTVFGDTVEGLDVVMKIVQGDKIESVRILRVGTKAQAFHPTTESFQAQLKAAEARVAEHVRLKRVAEEEWLAAHRLQVSEVPAVAAGTPVRVRYRGRELHYVGDVVGREGPPLEEIAFASIEDGTPAFVDSPQAFLFEPGKTKLNPGLEATIASMRGGEKRMVVLPAARAYGRTGYTAPQVAGRKRLVISPNTMVIYEVELLP